MQSEEDVRAYVQQHIWQPLEQCPTPEPFSEHKFWQPTTVGGLKGAPDWTALGYGAGSEPGLLLAIESKTRYSMPVPERTSLAGMYADKLTGPLIEDALHQLFSYMHANSLPYGVLVTGEVYAFLERQGSALRIADIHGEQSPADSVTLQMGIYFMLHKAAQLPGELVIPMSAPKPEEQQVSKVAGQQGRSQLAPDNMSKDVWTWDELNLTGWIAQDLSLRGALAALAAVLWQ